MSPAEREALLSALAHCERWTPIFLIAQASGVGEHRVWDALCALADEGLADLEWQPRPRARRVPGTTR